MPNQRLLVYTSHVSKRAQEAMTGSSSWIERMLRVLKVFPKGMSLAWQSRLLMPQDGVPNLEDRDAQNIHSLDGTKHHPVL